MTNPTATLETRLLDGLEEFHNAIFRKCLGFGTEPPEARAAAEQKARDHMIELFKEVNELVRWSLSAKNEPQASSGLDAAVLQHQRDSLREVLRKLVEAVRLEAQPDQSDDDYQRSRHELTLAAFKAQVVLATVRDKAPESERK